MLEPQTSFLAPDISLYSTVHFDENLKAEISNTYIIDDIVTFRNDYAIPCIHKQSNLFNNTIPLFGVDTTVFPSEDINIVNASILKLSVFLYFLELRITRINWQQEYRIDVIVGNRLLQKFPPLSKMFVSLRMDPLIVAKDIVECV